MKQKTTGTVLAAKKQWWLKVNKEPVRIGASDGAAFPYIVKIRYIVNGQEFIKNKWLSAGLSVPEVGSQVTVIYDENKPSKCELGE